LETQVLIIGGGITGTGLARDLALRGVVCTLVEQGDINAGASGANHGLLHSGARYVANDPSAARECRREGELLKKLGAHCVEDTGGLFVAVQGDDEGYVADFPSLCSRCDIPVKELDPGEARRLEPALSEKLIAAFLVEDATIDPFRLSLENIWQAQEMGATLLRNTQAIRFQRVGRRLDSVLLLNKKTGEEQWIRAEQVVNASGAWSREVAALAEVPLEMVYSKGTLLVTFDRITRRVVNRLRRPGNADILVPGGSVSLLGTTSIRIPSLDQVFPTVEEVDLIVDEESAMLPVVASSRYVRAYAGVRPLIGSTDKEDTRSVSRNFALLDHEKDGLDNFVTITGGKFTTYRLMAEKAGDLVCRKLGISVPCLTRSQPLPSSHACHWTETGIAPQDWIRKRDGHDLILCECELVPQSAVNEVIDSIRKRRDQPDLEAIGLRSRVGKGPCQGTYCSVKVAAHLVDRSEIPSDQSRILMKDFLCRRWRGQHPILWGRQMDQAELMESLHCGVFCQELYVNPGS